MSDWEKGMSPEAATRVRLLIRQFRGCRGLLIKAQKENEALKRENEALKRRLGALETTARERENTEFLDILRLFTKAKQEPEEQIFRY